MRTVTCTTEINAPAKTVWQILADTTAYREWNPFITTLSGHFHQGEKLEVTIVPPGGKPMSFSPTVTEHDDGRRLAWLGRLLMPGIFDGAHSFTVIPLSSSRSRFVQTEEFSGLLVPLTKTLLANTESGFAAMNAALAERAER